MSEFLNRIRTIHARRPYSLSLLESGSLHRDVVWWAAGSQAELPWAGRHVGTEGISNFFRLLGAAMTYDVFDVTKYVAAGNDVVAIMTASGTAKATGRPFASDIVRIYTFGAGKIVEVRNFYDTAAYRSAMERPGPA
jgi:ketosteroid isomerase-like protein